MRIEKPLVLGLIIMVVVALSLCLGEDPPPDEFSNCIVELEIHVINDTDPAKSPETDYRVQIEFWDANDDNWPGELEFINTDDLGIVRLFVTVDRASDFKVALDGNHTSPLVETLTVTESNSGGRLLLTMELHINPG